MAIEIGDVLSVAARGVWQGISDIMNRFHIQIVDTNANTQQNIINDITIYISDIYTAFNGSVPNDVTWADINLFNVTKAEPLGSYPWVGLTTGASVAEAMPPGVAIFGWLPTPVSECFGRKWWGPFAENVIIDGIWMSNVLTAVSDGMDLMVDLYTAIGGTETQMQYVVQHAFEDKIELIPPQYILPFGYNLSSIAAYHGATRRPGAGS